jgi:transcriptional regulator with XRE-family HTH domain
LDFSSRFKKVREHFGISQKEMAELFEVAQRTLSNWETGRNEPSLEVLQKLYLSYRVNLNWLLTGTQQEAEIVQDYKTLDEDKQEIFYHELKTAALKAKKKKRKKND